MAPLVPLLVAALAAIARADDADGTKPSGFKLGLSVTTSRLPLPPSGLRKLVDHLYATNPDIGPIPPLVYGGQDDHGGEDDTSAPPSPGRSGTPLIVRKAPRKQVAGIVAGAAAVRTMGLGLRPALAKQWADLLAFTRKDFRDFERKVQGDAPGDAVADMIAKLNVAADVEEAKVRSLAERQGRDVAALVAKYTETIRARLDATDAEAADDSAMNALRAAHQALVLKWQVALLTEVNVTRTAFMRIIAHCAGAAGEQGVKKALKNAGKRLVWRLIDEQVRYVTLLTKTQGPQLASFTIQASKVLFQIAAAAEADSL